MPKSFILQAHIDWLVYRCSVNVFDGNFQVLLVRELEERFSQAKAFRPEVRSGPLQWIVLPVRTGSEETAAIPSGLLESELFGHEKGTFTGALIQRRGRFELADHGSLFLDEIGDISLELQPKLLRAVQEQEFERLGSSKTIHVDARIIAATHQDLAVRISEGKFREDLFYRLNVFPIKIPALRERREDIPLLVNYFVSKLSRRMGKNVKSVPKQAMEVFANASWPGNVRELQNFIERAVILTQGSELSVPVTELADRMGAPRTDSMSTLNDAQRQVIVDALKAASGRIE